MSGQKGMVCIAKTRPPSLKYKIRQLTTNNKTGDAFGITVPSNIATSFIGVLFKLEVQQDRLVFISGALQQKRVNGQNENISSFR